MDGAEGEGFAQIEGLDMNKYSWHKVYKKEVFEYYNYQCTNCMKHINIHDGVVHHNTYKHKSGIYTATAKELIQAKKITLLCNSCHTYIHQTESIDGLTRLLGIDCIECGEETPQGDIVNGRCDICHALYIETLNDYIF